MSSEITICNLALANLGDTAQVTSISPPDQSVQAQLCARFYPVARNSLLELHSWAFATVRCPLALLDLPDLAGDNLSWQYAYAEPTGLLNVLAIVPPQAPDDYQSWYGPLDRGSMMPYPQGYQPVPGAPLDVPQPYAMESTVDGTQIILTDVPNAVLRYTMMVTDPNKFSWLFTTALSWLMSSMLAGPLLKGDVGRAASVAALQTFKGFESMAEASDANQRKTRIEASPAWIRGR